MPVRTTKTITKKKQDYNFKLIIELYYLGKKRLRFICKIIPTFFFQNLI